ncbi:hypothetical protein ACU8V3_04065 [Cobetia marina]
MSGKGMVENKEMTKAEHALDLEYYKSRYHDLKLMSDAQIINHWYNYGKPEGRVCSGDHAKSLMLKTDDINAKENSISASTDSAKKKSATGFKTAKQAQDMPLMKPFDDAFYAALYPDLEKTRFYKEKNSTSITRCSGNQRVELPLSRNG